MRRDPKRDTAAHELAATGDDFDEVLQRVGRRIRELRKMQGLTLPAFQEFTGVGASVLSRLETGKDSPTLRTLHRVARGLGVHLHELFVPQEQSGVSPRGGERSAKKKSS